MYDYLRTYVGMYLRRYVPTYICTYVPTYQPSELATLVIVIMFDVFPTALNDEEFGREMKSKMDEIFREIQRQEVVEPDETDGIISCSACGFRLGNIADVRRYSNGLYIVLDASMHRRVEPFANSEFLGKGHNTGNDLHLWLIDNINACCYHLCHWVL